MRKHQTVLLVMVAFKWDLERCGSEIEKMKRSLGSHPVRAAMHAKRLIAFVVQTSLNSRDLMNRMGSSLRQGCVERAWVYTAGSDIVATDEVDPLTERVAAAWAEVRKPLYTQNLRSPKAGDIFVKRGIKDADRGTAVKMGIKPR
jgi:hypothetical protein